MDVLDRASELSRKRQWDEAISLLTSSEAASVKGSEEWFLELAKTYRIASRREAALSLLEQAERELPSPSARIQEEKYHLHVFARDYASALGPIERLIEIDPSLAKGHFLKGSTLVRLGRFEQAREAFIVGLSSAHSVPFEKVIERVEAGLASELESQFPCETEYIVGCGGNNLGILIHRVGPQTFITKIARWPGAIRVASNFYQRVVPVFPELRELTPAFIHGELIDDIYYLTVEYLEGTEPIEDDAAVELVLRLSRIGYAELREVKGLSKPTLMLVNRPTSLFRFFRTIHRKAGNRALFEQLAQVLHANAYPDSIQQMTTELSILVQRSRAFTLIDPERHYCLTHNDFRPDNLVAEESATAPRMIDCGGVRAGLRFADLASYFGCQQRPFEHFDACFQRHEALRSVSVAERVYLNLAFLYYSVLHAGAEGVSEIQDSVIAPAASAVRLGVVEIYEARQARLKEVSEAKQDRLREQLRTSRELVRSLEREIDELQNSTSWKMTAPLRKLMDGTKRQPA